MTILSSAATTTPTTSRNHSSSSSSSAANSDGEERRLLVEPLLQQPPPSSSSFSPTFTTLLLSVDDGDYYYYKNISSNEHNNHTHMNETVLRHDHPSSTIDSSQSGLTPHSSGGESSLSSCAAYGNHHTPTHHHSRQLQQQQQQQQQWTIHSSISFLVVSQLLRKLKQYIPLDLAYAIIAWYGVGVVSIVTTKIILSEYDVPPLVLTVQQLVCGSTVLKLYLTVMGDNGSGSGIQPVPPIILHDDDDDNNNNNKEHPPSSSSSSSSILLLLLGRTSPPIISSISSSSPTFYIDFILAGLFNALDFLASNTCFSFSVPASFVETIKASEPISTTMIALFFGIDTLRFSEAISLGVLICGVICATMGNSISMQDDEENKNNTTTINVDVYNNNGTVTTTTILNENNYDENHDEDDAATRQLHLSIKTAIIVMTANICFALRAKSQKIVRKHPMGKQSKLTDGNLLMRMQQIGAMSLLGPFILFEGYGFVTRTFTTLFNGHIMSRYLLLTVINSASFSTYSLASCYVLSKVSVVQHAGLGCCRRMFAIVFTSLVFGVPMTLFGALGILLCFGGFCSFTYFRYQQQQPTSSSSSSSSPELPTTPLLPSSSSSTLPLHHHLSSSQSYSPPSSSSSPSPLLPAASNSPTITHRRHYSIGVGSTIPSSATSIMEHVTS